MIKATGKLPDGTPLLLLVLSGENMARLMADEPIMIDASALGLSPCKVILIGGRTQAEIIAQLERVKAVPPGLLKPIDERST